LGSLSRLPVTSGLILACVTVYVGVAYLGQAAGVAPWNVGLISQPGPVLFRGALVPALVAEGEWWRLLSSIFLHSGFVHLAFNMMSLYFLGSFAEATFGRSRFLALYVLSGVAGGIAYLYFGQFDRPAVGASGAIFGLLGVIFGFALRRGSFSWQNPLIRQLLILTALNLYIGFSVPNISNTAHIGGLVGGLAFGWLMAPTVYARKKLKAATPVMIVLGVELLALAAWLFYFA
jgi:rhomboid protease GluP